MHHDWCIHISCRILKIVASGTLREVLLEPSWGVLEASGTVLKTCLAFWNDLRLSGEPLGLSWGWKEEVKWTRASPSVGVPPRREPPLKPPPGPTPGTSHFESTTPVLDAFSPNNLLNGVLLW